MADVQGTNGDDVINAADGVTDGNENIYCEDGDDTASGLGGNDFIFGGDHHDTLFGGDGDDVLSGGDGDDWLSSGEGAEDRVYGQAGIDTASYGGSHEGVFVSLLAGQGSGGDAEGDLLFEVENIHGSEHDDTLVGDGGSNELSGFAGSDLLMGGDGADALNGGGGNDSLEGGDGVDTLSGGDDNDLLEGGNGIDTLNGGDDADTLKGGGGADTLNGGAGVDTADYSESGAAVIVSLETGDGDGGQAEGDELNNIENLTGSAYADGLLGDDGANVLRGLDGSDTLKGGGGADTLYGGDGADELAGMNGSDTLYGENGQDTFYGGNGRDFLTGGNGGDTFVWWDTSETSTGTANADVIRDFNRPEGDRIDLSSIDANVYAGGNQAFSFIGTDAFSGTPGEIRYYHSGGNTYIEMQTGNSVDVEGVIRLDGIHTPQAGWFML